MKAHKFFLFLVSAALAVALFTGCSGSANPGGGEEEITQQGSQNGNEVALVDYNFKVTNFPYGSEGFKVIVIATKDNKTTREEIGTVTSTAIDAYLEKTVKLPADYDKLILWFYDTLITPRYFINISKDFKDHEATDVCEVNGYYYYYYESSDPKYNDKTAPYAATDEVSVNNFELGTKYKFDGQYDPFKIGHLTNVLDKKIKLSIENGNNTDFYISSKKADIMTYKASKWAGDAYGVYECKTNDIYIMVKPKSYDTSLGIPDCSFTFVDFGAELENTLKIDKSIIASDGKLYATGTSTTNHSKTFLWCIDPADGSKTQVHNFYSDITVIHELEEGILYIAHDTSISKYNLETKEVSTLVSDLPVYPKQFITYKDGKLVVVGRKNPNTTEGNVVLLEESTGNWKIVEPYSFQMDRGDPDYAEDLFYIPEQELFIHSRTGITPKDISFMVFTKDSMDDAVYYSYDSQYHGDYSMRSPTRIISTDPLEVMDADGNVFSIDTALIKSIAPDASDYYSKIKQWCVLKNTAYRAHEDCIITDEFIYYMNYNSADKCCTVEKCAVGTPKQVIKQEIYEDEKGIKLYSCGDKIYLLTNGVDAIYRSDNYDDYKVFLHEIDF